jgi:hypothetical protein
VYAATADDTAVINSVLTSMPPDVGFAVSPGYCWVAY